MVVGVVLCLCDMALCLGVGGLGGVMVVGGIPGSQI